MKRMQRILHVAALIFLPIFITFCASTSLPPLSLNPATPLESDEKQIWESSLEEQGKLDKSEKVIQDPLMEEYLGEIGLRLLPAPLRDSDLLSFRFKVINDSALNAFAYPNGALYVHSGLIARVENEAQLATIIAHEMSHSIHRHAVRSIRNQKNKQLLYIGGIIGLSFLFAILTGQQLEEGNQVGAQVLNNTARILIGLGLPLAILASINGYSREMEREADEVGMGLLARANYDLNEAPKIFELFQETYGDSVAAENFFFGSHPQNSERIGNYQELLAGPYVEAAKEEGRIKNTAAFFRRTRVIVRENALLDIQGGRFNLAQRALDRVLGLTPRDPIAHFYYGEFHRLSEKTAEGEERAISRYQMAMQYNPQYPEPFRAIGLIYYGQNKQEEAREALEKYLSLEPKAKDREQIREYLLELNS